MICLHKFCEGCSCSHVWPVLGLLWLMYDFVCVDYMSVVMVVASVICYCCVCCEHGSILCLWSLFV